MRKNLGLLLVLALIAVLTFFAYWQPAADETVVSSWDVPAEDGQIKAAFTDDGDHGYVLTLEGSGKIKDFADPKEAPWYSCSGRVTKIVLPEGITAIGNNAFAACGYVKAVIHPESTERIGSHAFPAGTRLCVYGGLTAEDGSRVYQYSEEKPAHGGYFWHKEGDTAALWDVTRVLFIGNSFTHTFDIDQLFDKVATGAGASVLVERITIGSHNISQFADPADEGGAMVEAALTANSDYDIIVLQEQSVRPITNFDLFQDGMAKLQKRINETQDHCQIYLYSTWGYPRRAEEDKTTVPEMEMVLRTAYADTAKLLGVKTSPVGAAFTSVYNEHPEINLYSGDQVHPSYAGAYLSACVHVGQLLGIDPRTTTFDGYPLPENPRAAEDPTFASDTDFSPQIGEVLREAAYTTVFGSNK